MDAFEVVSIVLALVSSVLAYYSSARKINEGYFNVMDYGATSDGYTDDSQAFLDAWDAACSALVDSASLYVPPEKSFLLNPVTFNGPCNPATINFLISGTIMAPESPSSWDGRDASQWLGFKDVNGLNVDGFGFIDGQGRAWWDQSCKYHPQLRQCTRLAPTALKFLWCNESSVSNLNLINSAQTHVVLRGCNSFSFDKLVIDSAGNSPNTDGIHISSCRNVFITNSRIGSGDDCISVGDHTASMEISNIVCGPGHVYDVKDYVGDCGFRNVEKIHVTGVFFNGTSNGARIKTWQVGRGYVRDITFENLIFSHVQNPIIIDQNYCNIRNACKERETGVQISNVLYKLATGTSNTQVAINLNCSRSVPCFGLSMESIQLLSANVGEQVIANCSNAYGQEVDVVPGPCLLR